MATIDLVSTDGVRTRLVLVCERSDFESLEELYAVQERMNDYIRYVESGQLAAGFPDLAGRPVEILLFVLGEPPLPYYGERLVERGREVMSAIGIGVDVSFHTPPRRSGDTR